MWHVANGSVNDPAVKARIEALLAKVAAAPSVAGVRSPYCPTGAAQISKDGKTAYATVDFKQLAQAHPQERCSARGRPGEARRVRRGCRSRSAGRRSNRPASKPPSNSVAIGLVIAAVILLLAFGSLLGMALPLVTAAVALSTALFAIDLFSHAVSVNSIAPTLAALIGLGVGIDYALFIVTRHRHGLKAGLVPEEAAVRALNTAGRAVIFAGGTVCIALLGLLVLRLSFLNGMAFASVIAVVLDHGRGPDPAAGASRLHGRARAQPPRASRARRDRAARQPRHGLLGELGRVRLPAPALLALTAVVVILVLAVPVLSLRLGLSDAGNDPASSTTRKAYDLLAAGFGPGSNGPLLLVAQTGSPADTAALGRLTQTLQSVPGVAAVVPFPSKPGAKVAIVQSCPPRLRRARRPATSSITCGRT